MKTRRIYWFVLVISLLLFSVTTYAQQNETLIKAIDAKVAAIEEFIKNNSNNYRVDEDIKDDSKEQPFTTNTFYSELNDSGRVVMHETIPTSESGDWSATYTHYFDEHGHTIFFKFYSSSFNSGCADVLRITKRYYFDNKFNLIKKEVTYTDKDDKPIKDTKRCDTYGLQREEPRIYKSHKDITREINKSKTPYIKEKTNESRREGR